MFKLITILTLVYFINKSVLAQTNKNQHKRDIGHCLGEQNVKANTEGIEAVNLTPESGIPANAPKDNIDAYSQSKEDNRDRVQQHDQLQKKDEIYYHKYTDHNRDKSEVQLKDTIDNFEQERQNSVPRQLGEEIGGNIYIPSIDVPVGSPLKEPQNYQTMNKLDDNKDTKRIKQGDNYNYSPNQLKLITSNQNEAKTEDDDVYKKICKLGLNGRRANNNEPVSSKTDNESRNSKVPAEDVAKTPKLDVLRSSSKYSNQLADPERGSGVTALSGSGVNLWEHKRVCYACSSASNPTCMTPDRRTTVKYCLKGHEACVTKTYQAGKDNGVVLIRDCGISCDDTEIPGPRFKTCQVCYSDTCNSEPFNGAFTIKSQGITFITFIIFVIKYTT